MRRFVRPLLLAAGLYALGWVGYVAKTAAGIDVIRDGFHHGPYFPGSDAAVAWLHAH